MTSHNELYTVIGNELSRKKYLHKRWMRKERNNEEENCMSEFLRCWYAIQLITDEDTKKTATSHDVRKIKACESTDFTNLSEFSEEYKFWLHFSFTTASTRFKLSYMRHNRKMFLFVQIFFVFCETDLYITIQIIQIICGSIEIIYRRTIN